MKKWKICLCICLLFFSICAVCPITASADEEKSWQDQLNENIFEEIEGLDTDALEEYLDSLEGFSDKSVGERILEYIKGDGVDYGSLGSQLLSVLFADVKSMLPAFACICAVALLCGILSSVKSSFLSQSTSEIIFLIAYAAALIPIFAILGECFSAVKESVEAMQTQMQIVFPLLLTLMAASGGSVTAAIYQPAVGFLGTFIVSLVTLIVLPVTMTVIVFSVAGKLSNDLKLHKFTAFFKSINKWIMGVCISVYGLFFTVQGLTSSAYDGIARRAAKYAIGNGVPIVGGFLSGGFDLAVAGSILIKNSLGSLSVVLLISVIFKPLVMLIAVNLFLRLTAAVTAPLGENRISDFLSETADNLNYCTAGLLFVAFLYFVSVVLIICSSEVIF